MPRKARIDAPGALHHIICRRIEGRRIFQDKVDRDNFVGRIDTILSETSTACYAWALMPNHFHLLLRTGKVPIATVMRRLLTGYAVSYNRRHRRYGHLLQNRYKSVLCQEDPYLLELVRYIHLNPLRARIVASLKQLDQYRYSGHSHLIGRVTSEWQDGDAVLSLFGKRVATARKRYRAFVEEGIEQGRRPELTGGGLVRSYGGWKALESSKIGRTPLQGDERILGDSDFVESVLEAAEEDLFRRYRLRAEGYDFEKILNLVAKFFDLDPSEILLPSKQRERIRARSLLCYWAISELGMTATELAHRLGVHQSNVSRAAQRGEKLAAEEGLSIDVESNA